MTHTLVLLVLGLAIGITTLRASAESQEAEPSPVPASSPVTDHQTPADVELRVGETASFDGGALQVTFVEVREDSRCPRDVMCVWMGRAVVVLHVVLDGVDRGDVSATLYPTPRNQPASELDAMVDRYVLSLVDLQPYPDRNQTEPAERVATIRVALAAP